MSVSVRTRFEVFKRDRFTCTYCGRTPPEVLLQVDHITPVAAGGGDEMHNLTTACATCNGGKAARLLEEGTAPVVGRATVEELAERVEQAKAYMELLGTAGALNDRQLQMVVDAWAHHFGAKVEEKDDGTYWVFSGTGREMWPNHASIRRFLRSLSLEDVLHAVEIAASRMDGTPGKDATRYFYGVCNRAIKEGTAIGGKAAPSMFTLDSPEVDDLRVDAWREGVEHGRTSELARIGQFLSDHADNGYATVEEAIAALWPDDE